LVLVLDLDLLYKYVVARAWAAPGVKKDPKNCFQKMPKPDSIISFPPVCAAAAVRVGPTAEQQQ
jgi:hypothetical protein